MKGFVGGIPLALLVAAVQVQAMEPGMVSEMGQNNFHQRRTAGLEPHFGGTAMGGPSGNDGDGSFKTPYAADVNTHSNVNEFSKDDHSVNIKNKDIHPPPPPPHGSAFGPGAGPFGPALGPGAGPFPKRHWPSGGTAGGGPSGNDEGQSFNMPITGNFHTDVNEYNKDDHSIAIKNKNIHPPPIIEAPVHPPFAGPPGGFRESHGASPDHFHVPATAFTKRFSPGGTAMGGPGGGGHSHGFPGPVISGGTAMGGPSGDDDDGNLNFGKTANIHSSVNEHSKDDHSVDIKHKDIYPPPPPFVHPPFGHPFKRSLRPHEGGGTAMGGPSGDDGGQEFNMPITIDTDTAVNESYDDDHSVDLKHTDVYPPAPVAPFGGPGPVIPEGDAPFRRAYSPDSSDRDAESDGDDEDPPVIAGGTAMGGPSGDDSGGDFDASTNVGVDSNVNEDHQDNHAIKLDTTTVHPPAWPIHEVHEVPVHEVPVETAHEEVPQMPWMTYQAQQHAAGNPIIVAETNHQESAPAPPTHRDEQEAAPHCSAEVHEVVRTVTKTQYKQVQATETVYKQAPVVSQVVQTSAIPMSAVPMESGAAPKILSSAVYGSQVAYASAPASSSYAPYESYNYKYQAPASSSAAAYSMIPVHVPMATPSSSAMYSMATPSASHGVNVPSGVSPDRSNMPGASASPSSNSPMFTGAATRVSGGLVSAAAAVVGVLAFVL
ncbi:hypothetical protein N7478_003528 [Penicillium angulare]|uniref:uncharacterized protein n=1 Tax=Penicillium angulare TaxID=116970 RepID=UPI00253F6910|nr:uncharacterized protein N7478_003528 [Penicillium angulare]KAJ5287842.1 hypothetical protein N7478_003528 [Penicillium angulare]